jgi:hypothetical protein
MHLNNQESGPPDPHIVPESGAAEPPPNSRIGPEPGAALPPPDPWELAAPPSPAALDARLGRIASGLAVWLVLLLAFGVGSLLFRMEELAIMVVLAGLFVVSQAADVDPQWSILHYAVAWVVPAIGLGVTFTVGLQVFSQSDTSEQLRMLMVPALVVAAAVCVVTALPPVANAMAAALFRAERPSHTLRLASRITVIVLVLAVPGWFALRSVFEEMLETSISLVDRASLEGQLVGYVLVALAAAGFLIRRDLRETLERLGLGGISARQLGVVAVGVAVLYGINAGADVIQQSLFHDLWESDHHVNQMIASGLGGGKVALLGVSAGIGEEITLRGALQPKLGLLMTSLLFAALHVQYSWFGIGVIFVLGLILGTIRMKTNTMVAMAVHAAYDVMALLSV